MSDDFKGLRVIWPPDGTRPPNHEHDIIFVHGLHGGPISDWQDENGICWPAEHLALDLGNARILAFGYDHSRLNVQSDGLYEGGVLFKQGRGLLNAVNTGRRGDKVQVPLTLVGHGMGGIVIKSALSISHLFQGQLFNVLLRKTKHVIFLDTPQADLTWDSWEEMSEGSPSAGSRGRWKVWTAALNSSSKTFGTISQCFNITSAVADDNDRSTTTKFNGASQTSKLVGAGHEYQLSLEDVDHRTISKLSKGSSNYWRLLARIQENTSRIMGPAESSDIRTWLGRRLNKLNGDSYQHNLDIHHSGTFQWLFEDARFRDWAKLENSSPILWLTGPEGCGKSVLCSVAAERLKKTAEQPAVLYLMLAFDRPQSEYHLMVQLALQLLEYVEKNQGGVDSEALSVILDEQDDIKKLSQVRELVKVLISQCPAVYIFLDGLDEVGSVEEPQQTGQDMEVDESRRPLHTTLMFLVSLCNNQPGSPLRLWCSSRKTLITEQWMKDLDVSEVYVDEGLLADDVANYLIHEIENIPSNTDSELSQPATMEYLTKASGCNFLLASEVLSMLKSSNASWIQDFIRKASVSMNELYQDSWDQIQRSSRASGNSSGDTANLATQVISLVTFAKRPLKLKEVEEALAISKKQWQGFGTYEFHCSDLLPHEVEKLDNVEIQRLCAPFIRVGACQKAAGDTVLRLSHTSMYSFLSGLPKRTVSEADDIGIGPDFIANACLKYLSQKRYANTKAQSVQDNPFFMYAAKHWHRHAEVSEPAVLEISSSFMKSPQFLVLTQLQSLYFDRHFSQDIETDDETRCATANIPQTLTNQGSHSAIAQDYLHFYSEWASFLRLGVTGIASHGDIGKCFWGALGQQNFFQKHASPIEKQQSFLLEVGASPRDDNVQSTPEHSYYQTMSDDGKRVAVWKIPAHRGDQPEQPAPDHITLNRQSWYVDGHRPPFPYGPQETLAIDTKQVHYGDEARIGRYQFRRERRGLWLTSNVSRSINEAYWEDITSRGPWTVRSRRKLLKIDVGVEAQNSPPGVREDHAESSAESSEDKGSESEKDSAVDEIATGNARKQFNNTPDSDSDVESDSEYESISDQSSASVDIYHMSSAEEFYTDAPEAIESGNEGSDDEFWMSPGTGGDSESDDDQSYAGSDSDSDSDSASNTSSQGSTEPKSQPVNLTTSKAQKLLSPKETPQGKDKAALKANTYPMHQFSWGRYCDLCSTPVVPSGYRELTQRQHLFYQCSPCGSRFGDSYDICSECFDKGVWCRDDSHLISKATFSAREGRICWEDGISQQAAMPIVKILAERRSEGENTSASSFRYTRRWPSMLHASRPIIHPTLPLLIYPLDGRSFLFGNLNDNTYFTYEIPFNASETAETSGSTCIPVSVNLRFSPCGKYLHVVRFTARNDSALLGPIRLHVVVLTLALSTKDVCSGKPRILAGRQSIDLGAWSRLTSQLPFAVSWTHSNIYISMSDAFLHVLRFPLRTEDKVLSYHEDAAEDVSLLSQQVPLPRSALSRPVYFFSNEGKKSAKIILGSVLGSRPQPPTVVYLNINDVSDWVQAKPGRVGSVPKTLQNRDDPTIEEPYADDDRDLMVKEHKKDGAATIEPVNTGGFQNWLESGFKRIGIYCPSCFSLGTKLAFLRPPPYLSVYHIDTSVQEDAKYKINWKVNLQSFKEALTSGCQFCCYVACRMLSFKYITHTTQFIGSKGTRCCAQGTTTEDPKAIQEVLDNLEKIEWAVKPEERMLIFECHPIDQDIHTRAFSKLAIRMPSVTVGAKGDAKFMPTMVMLIGSDKSGETQSITSFFHSQVGSHGTPECVLEMYSLPDDAAHQFTDTRPLTTSRGGEDNLAVAKGWLEDCKSNHAFCKRCENTDVSLPARLIEIVDSETAQLVETAGRVGQYVALSYCWGPDPEENNKTTTANIESRLQPGGLPRDRFPGAIRDAITVSERLGIKHIWVDALCIIQDDPEDKTVELGKMSQYYRSSYLTIAVSTARCTMGFVGTMGRCENHPDFPLPRDLVPLDIFSLYRDTDEGKSGKLYVREENPYHLSQEPINKRAWTLQECVLAPRVLLFGSRVLWFCQHMTRSDGGVEDWSFDESDLEGTRRQFQIELNKLDREDGDNMSKHEITKPAKNSQDIYDLWHRIVQTYSRRGITHSVDKFPAISAIAAEFARLSRDDYLAGSWRSNLPRDLLWTTPNPATYRPEAWRAPTWSWASVDDAILYNQLPPKDATLLAEVIKAEVVPLAAEVPFGEIGQASLEITAPSFAIKFGQDDDLKKISAPWLKSFLMKGGTSEREMLLEALKMNYRSDKRGEGEKEEFQLPEEVRIVIIYGKRDELVGSRPVKADGEEKGERWTAWGLILKPVAGASQEDTYERVIAFSQVPMGFPEEELLLSFRKTSRIV